MTTTLTKVLGVALVAVVAFSGFAAATGGVGVLTTNASEAGNGFGPGDGTGPINASEADRPLDGSNSPWVTGDERLDAFQDRFNLTDEQIEQIQSEVTTMIEDGADRAEIRATITEMLTEFGVDDPVLGPAAGVGQQSSSFGQGPAGNGAGNGYGPGNGAGRGPGVGQGAGPHGPADGSCLN
ncbi:MAG: hypothetical protein ABEJ58_05720 [Halodesulfurarchaeum sp.]